MELKKSARPYEHVVGAPLNSQLKRISGMVALLYIYQPLLSLEPIGPRWGTPIAHNFRMGEYVVDSWQIRFVQKTQGEVFRWYNNWFS